MRTAFLLLFVSVFAHGQALRDINYKYLYDGSTPFTLSVRPLSSHTSRSALFYFQLRDTTGKIDNFSLTWETRTSLSDKSGIPISGDSVSYVRQGNGVVQGRVVIPPAKAIVLVGRVVQKDLRQAWLYFTVIGSNSPEHTYAEANGIPIVRKFTKVGNNVQIKTDSAQVVSFYDNNFPAGTPAFSEGLAKVSQRIRPDTVFALPPGQTFVPEFPGLYLVQPDTLSSRGLAFRAETDYPRFSKLESLADPLIYICTRQEYDRIKKAKGDKPAFDRVILAITGEKERAKIFMRTFFKRVEAANDYFSSYKEGWKTDRGMIYIVFGPPETVYKFSDREVWKYDNGYTNVTFEFTRSSTIFDPENYVLIRQEKFKDTWYEAIDLRRNAQF